MTTKAKNLGICMDHASARIIEIAPDPKETGAIASAFTHEEKKGTLANSEYTMHKKEQQEQAAYYSRLGEVIKKFDAVLLFGPTNAKQELFNVLKADHHFEKIKIEVKQTDKMTENQQDAFVREYFSKN